MARTKKPRPRYTPRMHYSAVELRDFEIFDLRIDYTSTTARRNGHPSDPELVSYERKLAHDVPAKLGHTALRQGESVECAKCGASGHAGMFLSGDVFWQPCGAAVAFGHEVTREDHERRARYERMLAAELDAYGRQDVGDEAIAAGHRSAALAYEARAKEIAP